MYSNSSEVNVVIYSRESANRLGMKKIASMAIPGCHVYADIESMTNAFFKVFNMPVNLFVIDMSDQSEFNCDNERLLVMLCKYEPSLKVIIYTKQLTSEQHLIFSEITNISVLSSDSTIDEACTVFSGVLEDCRYYKPVVIKKKEHDFLDGISSLSDKEKKVLLYYLDGTPQHKIAEILCRSIKTINAQKCSAIRKLGFKKDFDVFLMKDALLNLLHQTHGFK